MATNKTGLDYFPFDINFFDDDKIQFVGARFGLKGENIAIRILCKIYSEGYFYKFGEDEALLFAKRVGDGCQYSFVNDVVYELVKRGFFDKSIFDRFKLLTSTGIQKRYFEAVCRRKDVEIYGKLLLIDVSKMDNVNILPDDVYIIDSNGNISAQSKVNRNRKEIKDKETSTDVEAKKAEEERVRVEPEAKIAEQVKKLDAAKAATLKRKNEFFHSLVPFVERYGKEMVRKFFDYWTEMNKTQTKMRMDKESSWELPLRLATWANRDKMPKQTKSNFTNHDNSKEYKDF